MPTRPKYNEQQANTPAAMMSRITAKGILTTPFLDIARLRMSIVATIVQPSKNRLETSICILWGTGELGRATWPSSKERYVTVKLRLTAMEKGPEIEKTLSHSLCTWGDWTNTGCITAVPAKRRYQ